MDRHLFLVGGRASGKTSVGREAALRLGADCVDTDRIVQELAGRSIAELVGSEGWEAFRDLETAALRRAAAMGPAVVACGGGMVLREENRALMREAGTVIYLRADPAVLAARLAADPDEAQRPSLTGRSIEEEVAAVMAEREPLYRDAAHAVVECSGSVEEVAAAVVAAMVAAAGSRGE